jgi:hypothetical protein
MSGTYSCRGTLREFRREAAGEAKFLDVATTKR